MALQCCGAVFSCYRIIFFYCGISFSASGRVSPDPARNSSLTEGVFPSAGLGKFAIRIRFIFVQINVFRLYVPYTVADYFLVLHSEL